MPKILVVDDDPNMVSLFSEHLKLQHYEVVPADSAERAFELVKEHAPDLVLADIEMPQGRPSGLARKLTKR